VLPCHNALITAAGENAVAKSAAQQPRVAARRPRQLSRTDRVGITIWTAPETRQQLRILALQSGNSVQALLDEAIELLFRERGRPRIVRGTD
jgi:hypothetical protein